MSKHLQSKSLVESINQAKQRSLDTAMETLQTQKTDFESALKNVQQDLKADFSQASQELIQSCENRNEKVLQKFSTLMTRLELTLTTSLTSLESKSSEITEQHELVQTQIIEAQDALYRLKGYESQLITTIEEINKESLAQAIIVLSGENQEFRKSIKIFARLPTLVMVCLTLLVIFALVADFTLIQRLNAWKTFLGTSLVIMILALIIFGVWGWIAHTKNQEDA